MPLKIGLLISLLLSFKGAPILQSREPYWRIVNHYYGTLCNKHCNRQNLTGSFTFRTNVLLHLFQLKLDNNSAPKKSKTDGRQHVLALEFDINRAGWDLKQCISNASGIDAQRLKLITAGKVIEDYMPLKDQNANFKVSIGGIALKQNFTFGSDVAFAIIGTGPKKETSILHSHLLLLCMNEPQLIIKIPGDYLIN